MTKKQNNNIPERVVKFINQHHVATIATCVDSESWCFNCFYAFVESEGALIFTSSTDTKHIKMVEKNPIVSGSIVLETKIVGKIRGLQFVGEMQKVENTENSKYRLKYLAKFPFAVIVNSDLWILKLTELKMTDNRLGFGTKLEWKKSVKS